MGYLVLGAGARGGYFGGIEECTRVVTPAAETVGIMQGVFSQENSTYGPSLLIDVKDGRPTEGEHTIGDLAERATRRGTPAPLLNAARCNLQAYEINR